MTGLHVICDINCKSCREKLGWKYVNTFTSIFKSIRSKLMKVLRNTKKEDLYSKELISEKFTGLKTD